MEKKKVEHYRYDEKSNVIYIYYPQHLTKKEKEFIHAYQEFKDADVVITEPEPSKKQVEARNKSRERNLDYYLGNKDKGIEPAIKSKDDQKYFNAIRKTSSRDGGGYFKAKSWWDNRNMLAKEVGAENWDSATKAQKDKAIELLYTVKIKKGKIDK